MIHIIQALSRRGSSLDYWLTPEPLSGTLPALKCYLLKFRSLSSARSRDFIPHIKSTKSILDPFIWGTHYINSTFIFKRLGECTLFNLGVKSWSTRVNGGWGVGLIIFWVGVCRLVLKTLTQYFRPKYTIFRTLLQTWLPKCIPYSPDPVRCGNFGKAYATSWRPKQGARFLFSVRCHARQHVAAKMVPQTEQTEYAPYFRPKWQNLYLISLEMLETDPPPPGGGGTHNIFGWGCAARSWKPLPYFRPKYTIFHTLFQTRLSKCIPYFRPCNVLQFRQLSIGFTAYGTSWRPNDVRVFFLRDTMSAATRYC